MNFLCEGELGPGLLQQACLRRRQGRQTGV